MKRIFIFLLFALTSTYSSFAQRPKQVLEMDAPRGSVKLTKSEFRKNFHLDTLNHNLAGYRNIVRKGDIIIGYDYNTHGDVVEYTDLEDWKQQIEYVTRKARKNVIYDSKIVKIGNIKFLLQRYEEHDAIYIHFSSEDINKQFVIGLARFNKADEAQARDMMNEILASVKPNVQ